jgi:hypothetical protein
MFPVPSGSCLRQWGTNYDRNMGTGGAYCATIIKYLNCSLSGWISNWKRTGAIGHQNLGTADACSASSVNYLNFSLSGWTSR